MFSSPVSQMLKRSRSKAKHRRTVRRTLWAFEKLECRNLLAGDITIYAAGETGEETMELLIDGAVVSSWTNVAGDPATRTFLPFTFSVGTSVTPDRVRVSFTNDYYIDGVIDRNLYVDKIVVDGAVCETEDPAVYSTGSWLPEDGIVPGYRQREVLNSDGYFQYAALESGSLIRILAAGSTGNENMTLLIDDVQVASWSAVGGNADNRVFNEFTYRAQSTVGIEQIKVAFTNDLYAPPVDYNLRVDSVNIDGNPYETETATTYSTGTYVPEYGQIIAGYWETEWLHSNGYFQYGGLAPKPGAFGLDSSSMSARENNGSVTVTVLRSGGSDGTVSIDYKTNQGSASAGSDYTSVTGTLVFQPGEIRRTVSIPITNDSLREAPETFSFVIENPQGGASLMAPRTATITIADDDLVLPNYSSFSSSTGLKLNGNAGITSGTLQLTPNSSQRRGSAFSTTPVPINFDTSFQTHFEFRTLGSTSGGEGLMFILHNDPNGASALGSGASGLGYNGITRSLAVEFDTVRGQGEISSNHVSIWRNGSLSNALATQSSSIDFNSGQPVNVWIDYDGDRDHLSVYISSTTDKPALPVVTATVDVPALVGSQAYFGFSAATSSLANAHRITSWQMNLNRPPSSTDTTPPTLVNQTIVSGLVLPTAVRFDSTGRTLYVSEKQGRVVVVRDGIKLSAPFLDISSQTNSASDRGLLDLALHPDFPATPYVYLLYTYDPPEVYQNAAHEFAGPDKPGNRAGRLMRVTADAATNYTTTVNGSELVLLGKNSTWNHYNGFINSTIDIDAPPGGVDATGQYVQDFIASDSESHTVASLAFAPDGSLYVATGDGASYNTVDPRAGRVQHIDSLSGKVLRIDPIDGRGYASNPFSDGNLDSNRSKVYQLGLRNPFRMTVDPASGRLYIGDVGWTQWEEINSGAAGANFGWPYYEGSSGSNQKTPEYQLLPEAQAFYESGTPVTASLYALNHAADGINAIVMGAYYSGASYPSQYQGNLFFNDLGQGIVRTAKLDAAGKVTSVETFTTGAAYVVQITQGPDGNLYYVDLDDGIIGRWQFVTETAVTASSSVESFAAQAMMTSNSALSSEAETTWQVVEPPVSQMSDGELQSANDRDWVFATEWITARSDASASAFRSSSKIQTVVSKLVEKLDPKDWLLIGKVNRSLFKK